MRGFSFLMASCAALVVGSLSAGCMQESCTDIFVISSAIVTVVDSSTNERVCGATVTALDPSGHEVTFTPTTVSGSGCAYAGISDNDESETTSWQVTAEMTGYGPASIELTVPHDGCHVEHAEGTVAITPI